MAIPQILWLVKVFKQRNRCEKKTTLDTSEGWNLASEEELGLTMESKKRKLPGIGLERRVRARAEPEPDLGDFDDEESSNRPSEDEAGEMGPALASGSEDEDVSEASASNHGPRQGT